jgi:hypothetical protein
MLFFCVDYGITNLYTQGSAEGFKIILNAIPDWKPFGVREESIIRQTRAKTRSKIGGSVFEGRREVEKRRLIKIPLTRYRAVKIVYGNALNFNQMKSANRPGRQKAAPRKIQRTLLASEKNGMRSGCNGKLSFEFALSGRDQGISRTLPLVWRDSM